MVKIQGATLDDAYLKQWAVVLDVADLLERAMKPPSLAPPNAAH